MRILIIMSLILAALITKLLYSQATSTITYDASTSVDIQTNADVCATNIIINGTFSGSGTICSGSLPVTLSSFTVSVKANNAVLMWVTETELNNSGFDIERRVAFLNPPEGGMSEWTKIAFIQGGGTTYQPKGYLFEDKKLKTGKYQYRLKQIDFNGNYEYFNLESDVVITPPKNFSVSQNYPNPSNPKSKIDYEIPISGKVSLKIYNITGQEIVSLVNETKEAGYYTAEFDGSNLASGVYFYRVIAEGGNEEFSKTKKMILLK